MFDGTKPPYTTIDEPNPLNKYGVSKLEGENITLINDGKRSSFYTKIVSESTLYRSFTTDLIKGYTIVKGLSNQVPDIRCACA